MVQPIEEYNGGEILYSLGNFVFDQYQRVATQHAEIVQVSFVGRIFSRPTLFRSKITKTGPEVETSITGRPLHVAAELEAHGRENLLSKSVFLP